MRYRIDLTRWPPIVLRDFLPPCNYLELSEAIATGPKFEFCQMPLATEFPLIPMGHPQYAV
jgi:hypothetical protein